MKRPLNLIVVFALLVGTAIQLRAQGTAFTYQGNLADGGVPANGSYDLRLTLYDAARDGASWHRVVTNSAVSVVNGLFTTTVDFDRDPFNGTARWLEIGVRASGRGGDFTVLSPRQPLTPAPYALYATSAGNALTATMALGVADNAVTYAGIANSNITSAKIADGQVVKSLNQLKDDVLLGAGTNISMAINGNMIIVSSPTWALGGNSGTMPGANFLGTTDNQSLEFKVNNQRALRLEPNGVSPNVIGGCVSNRVTAGALGAFIGGGGMPGGPNADLNQVTDSFGVVAGGYHNTAGNDNGVSTDAQGAAVGGGAHNLASGEHSTVPGGYDNEASGNHSFAAGYVARARHHGSFVWADNSLFKEFESTANNEFSIRAAGGVRLESNLGVHLNAANGPLVVRDYDTFTSGVNQGVGRWGLFMEPYNLVIGIPNVGGRNFQVSKYNPDGTRLDLVIVDQAGNMSITGAYSPSSDRNAKQDFATVDSQAVLDKVAQLPIQTWTFKNDPGTQHVGPMAQDFHAAFGVGPYDKHIATVDADGVALAAIQGLNQKLDQQLGQQRAELKGKQAEIDDLKQRLAWIEKLLSPANEN